MNTAEKKPRVELTGMDGNAFAVLACCRNAARKAGWLSSRIQAFTREATAGDYDHLIQTCIKYFDTCADQGEYPHDTA